MGPFLHSISGSPRGRSGFPAALLALVGIVGYGWLVYDSLYHVTLTLP